MPRRQFSRGLDQKGSYIVTDVRLRADTVRRLTWMKLS